MLEVKNLFKIYKTKNGADVKALDGVSLQFPEKGMVFLLGKSGSGKSTLLNVCGGLDGATDGEIIVKGKSSKKFSQGDFDSYRNTCVGFIFQEYNILNEFSVEDNIALALELQGKPKDKKAVADLLKQVDLEGYAKRKPNTLSGGQKQRIAIARALVKSPEIIMADEPTGALDSATGKQVFETLKKLSQDKLVLVVSHDREFAEQYGDRIIELKDGKVLSDVTKAQEQQRTLSENINAVGDVLCIKNGADLQEKDFDAIKAFLKKSVGDIIIANNERDVNTFKKANRITDDGEKEVFLDTKEEDIKKKEYRPEDSKFIRSKLPAKHAIKIGLSSLKTKPIRLFFTVLLCTIAFTLFGLLSTMNFYNSEATFKQTMLDTDQSILRLKKIYKAKETGYENGKEAHTYDITLEGRFSQSEIDSLKSEFGADVFGGVSLSMNYSIGSTAAPYWMSEINMVAFLPDGHSMRNEISGSYPTTKDEICLSSYVADVIINCKAYDSNGNLIDVTNRDELIGKQMAFGGTVYKIVGIFDSGVISEKFDVLKSNENENNQLTYELMSELNDGLHMVVFVNAERVQQFAKEYKPYKGEELRWYRNITVTAKNSGGKYEFPEWGNMTYEKFADADKGTIVYTNGEKASLADNEVVINRQFFAQKVYQIYAEKVNAAAEKEDWSLAEKYNPTMELCSQIEMGGVWKQDPNTKKDNIVYCTEAELINKINQLLGTMKKDGIKLTLGAKLFNNDTEAVFGELKEFTIAGINVKVGDYTDSVMIVSDALMETWWNEQKVTVNYYYETVSSYKDEADAVYENIFLPYDKSQEQTNKFWEMYSNEDFGEDESRMKPTGVFIETLELIDGYVKDLSKIFLYVGLVLAVFAALLLSNFISVSISQKKKEIGILRAVGARGLDVFKIFFSESFFIGFLCVVFASIATILICGFLNKELAASLGASLFVFGVASLVVLIAIAFVTIVIATFLPVWNAARKKPVDSIRSL